MQTRTPLFNQDVIETPTVDDEVELLNGTKAPESLVKKTMVKMLQLKDPFNVPHGILDPMSLVFLVDLCRNPSLQLLPFTKQQLINYGFLDNAGNLPEVIKNIVLSGTVGSGGQIELLNPIKDVSLLNTQIEKNMQLSELSLFKNADVLEKAAQLFGHVKDADYAKAEELIKGNTRLMFCKIQDQGNVSPLQLAFQSFDTYMWRMFYSHIKDDPLFVARFNKQAASIENVITLTPLFSAYENYINIIHEWRKAKPENKLQYRKSGIEAAETIARLQRKLMPAHMIREMCRRGNNWGLDATFDDENPPEKACVLNDHEASFIYRTQLIAVLPYETNKGLGHEYGIARNDFHCYSYACNGTAPDDFVAQNNLDGLKKLFSKRKQEFYQFFPNIVPIPDCSDAGEENDTSYVSTSMCRIV